jgi:anti-anti-sigma factor
MPTPLTLDTARADDGHLVLTVTGEIDLSNVDPFTEALTTATAGSHGEGAMLTVDLSGVAYVDSAAVNALFSHADRIHVIAHPLLVRIFDITGLTELSTVEPSSAD